jgi:UPF0271 protein
MGSRIDFNCDMGESFGSYKLGYDEEVIKYISSANIACGFHAGDPDWMHRTVRLAEEHGVAIGAHPSFPDLRGFGRRNMTVSSEEARNDLVYQIGALTAFTRDKKLQHVKPHGAMYNMATDDGGLAKAICQAVLDVDRELVLVVLAGTVWVDIAKEMGVRVAQEVFADRALNLDGTLVPRSKPGSVIHNVEDVVGRSIKMVVEGKAAAIHGQEIEVQADTLCLHGDTPEAVEMAAAIRTGLETAGVEIVSLNKLVRG